MDSGDCLSEMAKAYSGHEWCKLSTDEMETVFRRCATAGAKEALASLGLGDKEAIQDVRDLRDILKAGRIFKKTAFATVMAGFGRVMGWLIILGIIALFVHNDTAMQLAKKLAAP